MLQKLLVTALHCHLPRILTLYERAERTVLSFASDATRSCCAAHAAACCGKACPSVTRQTEIQPIKLISLCTMHASLRLAHQCTPRQAARCNAPTQARRQALTRQFIPYRRRHATRAVPHEPEAVPGENSDEGPLSDSSDPAERVPSGLWQVPWDNW